MTISSGTRLGSYEILAPLGAGGMGEVCRANDTVAAAPSTAPAAPVSAGSDRFIASGSKFLTSWSPDGRFIAFNGSTRDTADDMWLLSVSDGVARPILQTPSSERDTTFSHELFQVASRRTNIPQFDPFPDGRSFIVNTVVTEKSSTPLTFVQNWTSVVRTR